MEGAGSLFISPATWSNHGRGTMPARCVVCGVGGSITCCGLKGVLPIWIWMCASCRQGSRPGPGGREIGARPGVCVCVREVSGEYNNNVLPDPDPHQIQMPSFSRSFFF